MASPSYDPESLLVGIIGRPHGLKGDMTLRVYNTRGADLSQVPQLIFERPAGREIRRLRQARRSADGWLVLVEGIDSRDAAASMTHATVRVRKDALPALGPDEFFVEDLLGCTVQTVDGKVLGVADSIFWNGAQDVMSVLGKGAAESGEAAGENLIPLVPQFLKQVDASARRIVVDWEIDVEPDPLPEPPSGPESEPQGA